MPDRVRRSFLLARRQTNSLPPAVVSGHSPLSLLRQIFFDLLLKDKLEPLFESILQLIRIDESETPAQALPPVLEFSDTLPLELRASLGRHLFGSRRLHELRLRLSLANFCWVCRLIGISSIEVDRSRRSTRRTLRRKVRAEASRRRSSAPSRTRSSARLSTIYPPSARS